MNKFKWYVYELLDPSSNDVFYVGKGSGNRCEQHEREAIRGVCSDKCNKIRQLLEYGLSPKINIVAYFRDEQDAYDFEAEHIRSFGVDNLTNIVSYRQSSVERKNRPGVETPAMFMGLIRKYEAHFASWLKWTDGGKNQVKVSESSGDKLIMWVSEIFYNRLAIRIFQQACKQKQNRDIISGIFRPYGLELQFEGSYGG